MTSRPPTARRIESPRPHACGLTDIGLRRTRNEDGFFVSPGGRILLVADGLGGLPAGDVASQTAIETVSDRLGRRVFSPTLPTRPALGGAMARAFTDAQRAIADPRYIRSGTAGNGHDPWSAR